MLDSKQKLVNPLILTLCLILSSCGFQLDRNQQKLPLQAKSIFVKKVQNQTYKEGTGIHLQALLEKELAFKKIQSSPKKVADLTLQVIVTELGVTTANQQDLVTANYEFQFLITAEVTLWKANTTEGAGLVWKKQTEGEYLFETAQSVLTYKEEKLGYQKAMESLAPKVAKLLTAGF